MKPLPTTSKELAEYLGGGWEVWTKPWPEYIGSLPGDKRGGATKCGWAVFVEGGASPYYCGQLFGWITRPGLCSPDEVLKALEMHRKKVIRICHKNLHQAEQTATLVDLRENL